jgi:hypothetical protein
MSEILDYRKQNRNKALTLQEKIRLRNERKIKIPLILNNKNTTIYLTFNQLKEANRQAKLNNIKLDEYFNRKYNIYRNLKAGSKQTEIPFEKFKIDVLDYLKKHKISYNFLSIALSRTQRDERLRQKKYYRDLKLNFKNIQFLARVFKIKASKFYRL